MKFIFDFDDVLFYNTELFKKHMYECLEKIGVPQNVPEQYYNEMRNNQFLPEIFISELLSRYNINKKLEDVYIEIISETKNFLNIELLDIVKKLGKDNCYLVTQGNSEFQKDKLEESGITPLFCEIVIVPESKKSIIEDFCQKHEGETVVFIDDRQKFFEDLDYKKCLNLKTILFDENGLEKLKVEIARGFQL